MNRSILTISLVLAFCTPSYALLTNMEMGGESIVYDDVNDVYWQTDLTRYTNLTWYGVYEKLQNDNLTNFGGINTWELASLLDTYKLWQQLDEETVSYFSDTATYDNYEHFVYGRTSSHGDPQDQPWTFLQLIWQYTNDDRILQEPDQTMDDLEASYRVGAWVISREPPSSVPEPATIGLIALSVIGLIVRRKFEGSIG